MYVSKPLYRVMGGGGMGYESGEVGYVPSGNITSVCGGGEIIVT